MEKSRNKFVRDKATKKYLYLHKNLNPTDAEKEALKKAFVAFFIFSISLTIH